jgi:hypothetical protein
MIELSDFRGSDCELNKFSEGVDPVFFGIWTETGGEPCDGCGFASGCKIKGHPRPRSPVVQVGSKPFERILLSSTNAEIAKVLDVTKRQVAKMRQAGTLEEALKGK